MAGTAPSQRRSGGWILPLLLVAMIVLPFVEVYLIVQVGQLIGAWWTLAILVAEALVGFWLMRREGARARKALNDAFASGKTPAGEFADTGLILVGGVLLIVPGFLTDVFGLVFLLPFTRPLARKVLAFFVARRVSRLGMSGSYVRRDVTVIEGETVPEPEAGGGKEPGSGPVIITGEIEDK
ncbi:MAG TPA: FxsA family protein [Microlunatus sp.]|nr:FxsA family protein [Microlunatus sp.]